MTDKDEILRLVAGGIAPYLVDPIKAALGSDGPSHVVVEIHLSISEVRDPLLTIGEVVKYTSTSTSTVDRWVGKGDLPCVRFGEATVRYDPKDVDDFVGRHRDPPRDSSRGKSLEREG